MEATDFQFIVGKPLKEAIEAVKPYYITETNVDGESLYISAQYDKRRLQVETRRGIVSKVVMIG